MRRGFRPSRLLRLTLTLAITLFMIYLTGTVMVHNQSRYILEGIPLPRSVKELAQSESTLMEKSTILMVEERFESRRKHLESACRRIKVPKPPLCEINAVKGQLKYLKQEKLLYCAVEKAGSTFWERIMQVVSGRKNASSPFDIETRFAYQGGYATLQKFTWPTIIQLAGEATTVVFVRHPFTRVFSAWLDKFFNPNPYYWHGMGAKIIREQRRHADALSMKYGHDVQFTEFVSFLIRMLSQFSCIDRHFSSNYDHCHPCTLSFRYIGKYETLKEDTFYILSKMELSDRIYFSDFEQGADHDAIRDAVDWIYSQKESIEKSMTFTTALFRVWKRLQSRGILHKESQFPYSRGSADTVTKQEFRYQILKAHTESDRSERAQNREEALTEAYSSLTVGQIHHLQELFAMDFDLFDYARNPSFLVNNAAKQSTYQYMKFNPD